MIRIVIMKSKFILFRRAVVFYSEDTTGKQHSLRTKDEAEALTLLHSKNEAHRQPVLNLQIARTYLTATDPEVASRTWQTAMDELTKTKSDTTRIRFPVFLTRRVFDAYVTVPPNVSGQDEAGRLWDIVSMLHFAIKSGRSDGDRIEYSVYVRNDIATHPHFNPNCECLAVLLLNTRRRVKGHHLVSIGTMDTILVHPREVFRLAIVTAASALIVLHNHPSGELEWQFISGLLAQCQPILTCMKAADRNRTAEHKKTMKAPTQNTDKKNQKSGLLSQPEQLNMGSLPQINWRRRSENRVLKAEKLLALLRWETPRLFELAEVVGRSVWIQFDGRQG